MNKFYTINTHPDTISEVVDKIISNKYTILYIPRGMGKSSFLNLIWKELEKRDNE